MVDSRKQESSVREKDGQNMDGGRTQPLLDEVQDLDFETGNPMLGSPPLVPDPAVPKSEPQSGIALALGGGAARGWAHIGVMRAFDEAQIPISMIAGTSIGALVGGCYLAGKLDQLEEFARAITRTRMLRYMDFTFRGSGLISGGRLASQMDAELGDLRIEDLDRRFLTVATDIHSGHEIWLEDGLMVDCIRASYALPGVFKPVVIQGRSLVDGAVVNPVPVSACRAHEAKVVVAVNLNSEAFGRGTVVRSGSFQKVEVEDVSLPEAESLGSWRRLLGGAAAKATESQIQSRLGVTGIMIEAFNIVQDRITRSRLAGDPPDYTIRPKLKHIGMADFHKAGDAIKLGYNEAIIRIGELESSGQLAAI